MIAPTTFNITTLSLLCLTVWVLWTRYRTQLENNWPLFYYIALVAYTKKFEESISPNWVFVCVVMALLLRFEFLGGKVLQLVKLIETIGLLYVILRCLTLLFG